MNKQILPAPKTLTTPHRQREIKGCTPTRVTERNSRCMREGCRVEQRMPQDSGLLWRQQRLLLIEVEREAVKGCEHVSWTAS